MQRSESQQNAGRVLYTYKPGIASWNHGNVLVTTETVELGNKSWDIDQICDVRLAYSQKVNTHFPMEPTPDFTPPKFGRWFLLGAGALILTIALFWADTSGTLQHPLIRLLCVVLFVFGIIGIVYSFVKNPPMWRVLTPELLLNDGQWHRAPDVIWYPDERYAADRTVEEIKRAVSLHQ